MTLPPSVELRESSIPGGGLGIFAKTFIKKFTWLAEYEGEIILDHDDVSDYAWEVSVVRVHYRT